MSRQACLRRGNGRCGRPSRGRRGELFEETESKPRAWSLVNEGVRGLGFITEDSRRPDVA